MGTVTRFEDLIAWQKARVLTVAVYRTTRKPGFCRDSGLVGQIQRAATSIMLNIAEGFEKNRPGEFHQHLSTAKGSCAEVRSALYVALDVGYISKREFEALNAQAEEVGRIIGGLRAAAARRKAEMSRSASDSALSTRSSALSRGGRSALTPGVSQ